MVVFLSNLKSGKYFGTHKVVYAIRVIEYQHRGMPHAHIVVKLSDMPDHEDVEAKTVFINEFITAKSPPTPNAFSTSDDKRYHTYVHRHMVHNCAVAVNGCKKCDTSKCKRGYEDTKVEPTHFDDRGYPIYERTSLADLKIVPHNKKILMDWNGHANVEYAGGVRCVLYLYKYLYKGPKKSSFSIDTDKETSPRDEISLYIKGRFLCSMDAMWRYAYLHIFTLT